MRYYVISDIHSFYSQTRMALTKAGYYADDQPHKLIICGDIMDRGDQSADIENWVVDLMDKDEVILIRGNHENLFCDFVDELINPKFDFRRTGGFGLHHIQNKTVKTAVDLISERLGNKEAFQLYHNDLTKFGELLKETDYYKTIIPSMINYFETDHYIFTHGWLPCDINGVRKDFRNICDPKIWDNAMWENGILKASKGFILPDKTIVCGHWHTSYGHHIKHNIPEFGDGSCFDIYRNDGIIAIDGCVAYSNKVNVLVIED